MCNEFWCLIVWADNLNLQFIHYFLVSQMLQHSLGIVLLQNVAVYCVEVQDATLFCILQNMEVAVFGE